MNLDHLEVNLEKDININRKKTIKKSIFKNLNHKKKNKFSRKQRRIINSGNIRNIKKLKDMYPHRFKCSSCMFSNSSTDPKFCNYFRYRIMDEKEDALLCNNIKI